METGTENNRIIKLQTGETMNSITIEELEKIDPSTCSIVDLRPEDQYKRGTFPGAVNIPVEQFDERKGNYRKRKTFTFYVIQGNAVRFIRKNWKQKGMML